MDKRCFLKKMIPISAKFLLWHPGGVSSNMHSDYMSSFILLEHSLSKTCFFTLTPACLTMLISARYASLYSLSDLIFSIASGTVSLLIVTMIMMGELMEEVFVY